MNQLNIITGGTSGIGLALAEELVKTADLALIYRADSERANSSLKKLSALNPAAKVKVFAGNLGVLAEAQRIFSEIEAWDNRAPSVLINSAGRSHTSYLVTDPIESMAPVFEDCFFSMLYMTQMVARKMYKARAGKIVSMSSIASEGKFKGSALYAAAKAAVEVFSKNTSIELFGRGVTINCVRPGLVRTPMTEGLVHSSDQNPPYLIPMEAVVAAVQYFLGPAGDKVTGQALTVHNGLYKTERAD